MADAERKMLRHEGDIRELYDLLARIEQTTLTTSARVIHQQARLNQIEGDLQGIHERLDAHGAALEAHGESLAEVNAKLDRILDLLGNTTP